MLARIQAALAALETTHGIRVLYACEAGSRAWGFASPDSDYDVRFIYSHSVAWYLRLDEGPDTLSFPVDEELDLAGWELRKALRLLRSSNAALFEWLQSPIVYHAAPNFREQFWPLLPRAFNLKAGQHHYLGQLRRGVEDELLTEQVKIKRLFYALRAALATRWIRLEQSLPPMELAPLRALLPPELQGTVEELLARKAGADEKTLVPRPAALVEFLAAEYAAGLAVREVLPVGGGKLELDAVLRQWVGL